MALADWAQRSPHLSLSILFVLWKALVLLIAIISPGIGYDTSTNLLLYPGTLQEELSDTPTSARSKIFNLVRWDAIYYSQMAQQGLVLEQQWAFGIGLSTTVSSLKHFFWVNSSNDSLDKYVLTGVILSHGCHWAAVMLLWSITRMSLSLHEKSRDHISFVAAALHIVSPAGIFLSAPYSESPFASLNLLGFYLYSHSLLYTNRNWSISFVLKVLAGAAFGLATMIRSNGVLSGIIFLFDAFDSAKRLMSAREPALTKPYALLHLQFTVLAGLCIALGMFIPQYIAYQQYCTGTDQLRPWCTAIVPSIFSFVQAHYWNVGFLRYWTWANLPLFAIATPVLYLMIRSGLAGWMPWKSGAQDWPLLPWHAAHMALPQLALAVLAIFGYHVQIINRLSSGYPFWYIWLALRLHKTGSTSYIKFSIVYALVQAGLYASFLPPA